MPGIAGVASSAGLNPVSCPHCGRRILTGVRFFEGLFRAIVDHVGRGEEVRVRGFGTFRRAVTPVRVHGRGFVRRWGSQVFDAAGREYGPTARIVFKQSIRAKALLNKKEVK